MRSRTRCSSTIIIIAVLCSLAAVLGPVTAAAQSPCLVQKVENGSSCGFRMCLYDAAGNVKCFDIAAGPNVTTNISLGSFIPIGAQDAFGNSHAFLPLPSPGCTGCMRLSFAALACCGHICYDQAGCTFRVTTCPGPC